MAILVDVPMPKTCAECPMLHYVTASCKALYTKERGIEYVTLYWHDGRHPNCPIRETNDKAK